jgi:uncharacterized membrane protein
MSSPSLPYGPERQRSDLPRGSFTSASGGRDATHGASRHARLIRQHHPRALAALCYTVPIIPAWTLLARSGSQRASRFVRFHAAQSLVFHGMVAASQLVLYLLLVILGGLVTSAWLTIALAVVLLILYVAQAIVIAKTWASLMADCIRGDARLLPLAGRLALRVEGFAPRAAWARLRGKPIETA